RTALAAMITATALWASMLLYRNAFGPTWLAGSLAVAASLAAFAVLGLGAYRVGAVAVIVGMLAALGGTAAFSVATAATPHQGAIPTALKKGAAQVGNWTGAVATNAELAGLLASTHTEWSAATNGSQSAAALEVASGTSVMAIGGWSGDPVPTLQSFIDDVHAGKIAYYVEAGRGAASEMGHGEVIFGHNRTAAHTREIAQWVAGHYSGAVIGESTVYRLT
ncbi:MAG: mannosyltransferase YkcB-related protein, partial [Mycobacterium sp.]